MNRPFRLPCGRASQRLTLRSIAPITTRSRGTRQWHPNRAQKAEESDPKSTESDHRNDDNKLASTSTSTTSTSNDEKEEKEEKEDLGLGLKAVWYAAEALGDVMGVTKEKKNNKTSPSSSSSAAAAASAAAASSSSDPLPRDVALKFIRDDYAVDYFISGKGQLAAYADDCEFRDPFAGFKGKARFVKNVSNLGSSLEEAQTELISWDEARVNSSPSPFLKTRWRFSGVVGLLPWRPRLAAAGSTAHFFDERTGLVVRHVEAWESSPAEVVKSLLRPANRLLPANRWEVAAACAYERDWRGLWFAASPALAKGAGLLAVASSAVKLLFLSGDGAGGGGGGGGPGLAELSLGLLAAVSAVTVVLEGLGIGSGIGKRR